MRQLIKFRIQAILMLSLLFCFEHAKAVNANKSNGLGPKYSANGTIGLHKQFSVADQFLPDGFGIANPTGCNTYPNTGSGCASTKVYKITDDIILNINTGVLNYFSDTFSCKVKVRIRYINPGCHVDSTFQTLQVTYNPKNAKLHLDKQVFRFFNAPYVELTVVGISKPSVARFLDLTAQVTTTYFDWLDINAAPSSLTVDSPANAKNEILLNLTQICGAEKYEVEYTFVDDYQGRYGHYVSLALLDSLPYSFEDNATRFTTPNTQCEISNVFEHGYILFRYRAVGRDTSDTTHIVYGKWSSDPYIGHPYVHYAPHTTYFQNVNAHEPTFDWQYNATFAEDGKRKEVVSYFDGSMRNRQMVTRNNADSIALIAETFYDHQGRPAVQALPTPDTSDLMKYYPNFNLNPSGDPYSRVDFDLDGGTCFASVYGMDTLSGAGRYYSENNPLLSGSAMRYNYFHAYTPIAKRFPFTVTEYESNNTGRIAAQSGVGADLALTTTGHYTKYYYGTPSPSELYRLFGSDIGDAAHYKKNMVKDANGQVSVSYLNPSGKVIATALAGDTIPGMYKLSSNVGDLDMTEYLRDTVIGTSIIAQRSILVPKDNSTYQFAYSLNDLTYNTCLPANVCYDCVYDLTISLTDDCGNELLHGDKHNVNPSPITRVIGKLRADFDTLCEDSVIRYKFQTDSLLASISDSTIAIVLSTGRYTITKTLTIDNDALDYYTDQYIQQSSCVLPFQHFLDQQLATVQPCNNTCETCKARLGDTAAFEHQYMVSLRAQGITTVTTDSIVVAKGKYDSLVAECNKLCAPFDLCQAGYLMMKADMMPGGQYAMFDTMGVASPADSERVTKRINWDTTSDSYSIFAPSSSLGGSYRNIHDYVYVGGQQVPLSDAKIGDVIAQWKESWADSLVKFHPEYCHYQFCEANSRSDSFDYAALNDNYDSASNQGILNLFTSDPFFQAGATGYPYIGVMTRIVNNYNKYGHGMSDINPYTGSAYTDSFSMQEVALAGFVSNGMTDMDMAATQIHAAKFDSIHCASYRNVAWASYRAMYLSEKKRLMDSICKLTTCSAETLPTGKERRYIQGSDAITEMNAEIHSTGVSASYSGTLANRLNDTLFIQQGIKEQCDSQCNSYVRYWTTVLKGCRPFYSPVDSYFIVYWFRNVCMEGCDATHPLGSSTVSTANWDTAYYKSFQSVLDNSLTFGQVNKGGHICDASIITMPMPYDHNYFATQDPNSNFCSCNHTKLGDSTCYGRIHYNKTGDQSNSFSVKDTSANSDCACKNTKNSLDSAVMLSRTDIAESSKCNHCINCDSMHVLLDSFYAHYLNVDTVSAAQLDSNVLFRTLLTSYLNTHLSFNLTYLEYLDFMASCEGQSFSDTSTYKKFETDVLPKDFMLADTNLAGLFFGGPLTMMSRFGSIQSSGTDSSATDSSGSYATGSDSTVSDTSSSGALSLGGAMAMGLVTPLQPGQTPLDTCGCNILLKMQTDSANPASPYFGQSVDSQFNSLYSSIIGYHFNPYAALQACKDAYHRSNPHSPWKPGAKWTGAAAYQIIYSDKDNGAYGLPHGTIQCPKRHTYTYRGENHDKDDTGTDPGGPGSPGDATRERQLHLEHYPCTTPTGPCYPDWYVTSTQISFTMPSCAQLADYLKAYQLRHHADSLTESTTDYIMNEEDSLRAMVGDTSSSLVLADFKKMSEFCSGSGGCSDPYHKTYCSYKVTDQDISLLNVLNEMVYDTTLIQDSLPVYSRYNWYYSPPGVIYPAGSSCFGSLMKEVSEIGVTHLTMRFTDTCMFENNLQLLFPDTLFDWTMIKKFTKLYLPDGKSDDTIHDFYVQALVYRPDINQDTLINLYGYDPDIPTGINYSCARLCNHSLALTRDIDPCHDVDSDVYIHQAQVQYDYYIDSVKRAFRTAYIQKCLGTKDRQHLSMRYKNGEYHYTLYYYDLAGNLIKTVPPKGVHMVNRQTFIDSADAARNNPALAAVLPPHELYTSYTYNTLNQLVTQQTPDAGESDFWYDRLGRLVVSKNAQQAQDGKYSYTVFDDIGRITEVGQNITVAGMSQIVSRDDGALASWLSGGTHEQITRTYYDVEKYTVLYGSFTQDNLRSRVSSITYQDADGAAFDYATHYSYDPHGNVQSLVQQQTALANLGQNYKKVDYDYDLISGKVNGVYYEKGYADQFIHLYNYDAENRLTSVSSSHDGVIWDNDADYYYYYHGPLGRMELGDYKVQGLDYAYTIQGWLKGVNSDMLNADRDMGRDGDISLTGNIHNRVASDAFGYSLNYFRYDYLAADVTKPHYEADYVTYPIDNASVGLYNGNIRHMVTAIGKFMPTAVPFARVFRYDVLNRLIDAYGNDYYTMYDSINRNWNGPPLTQPNGQYYEHFSYDENGNILSAQRNGDSLHNGSWGMDSLTYDYYADGNKLKRVEDLVNKDRYKIDLDDQADSNYTYDLNGNLVADKAEEIQQIDWTVYGKVRSIMRKPGSKKPDLYFAYGPDGQRVLKIAKYGIDSSAWSYTYYVRDAQGNILATYSRGMATKDSITKDSVVCKEMNLYGSSRLGLVRMNQELILQKRKGAHFISNYTPYVSDSFYSRWLGKKRYELCNHLGNVLATVSDRRLQHRNSPSDSMTDYHLADLITAQDYYAFGAPMPTRTYTADSTYAIDSGGYKDTCITCAQLKEKLKHLSGISNWFDSTNIAIAFNKYYGISLSANTYMTQLRKCRLLRDSLGLNSTYTQYIQFTDAAQYHFGRGNFTAEAWVNMSSTTASQVIMSNQKMFGAGNAFTGFNMYIYNGRLYMNVGNGQSHSCSGCLPYIALDGYTTLPAGFAGKWHHIVGVRSGSGDKLSDLKVYIDGGAPLTLTAETDNVSPMGNANIDSLGVLPLKVGSRIGSFAANSFNGYIKQARLYSRAMDSAEVNANAHNWCTGAPTDTAKLVFWAPLDHKTTETTTPDVSKYNTIGGIFSGVGVLPTWSRTRDTICNASASDLCATLVPKYSYDTCVACGTMKAQMIFYPNYPDLSDTTAITNYLNSVYNMHQTVESIKRAMKTCYVPVTDDSLNFTPNRYVKFPDSTKWQYRMGKNAFTLECWFHMPNASTGGALIANQNYTNPGDGTRFPGFMMYVASNRLYFTIGDNKAPVSGTYQALDAYAPIPGTVNNVWHHAVAVRPANSRSWKDIQIYIDGILQNAYPETDNTDLTTANIDSAAVLRALKIGSRIGSFNPFYFKGSIHQARVYRRAITADEVWFNYNQGCMRGPTNTDSLVLWAPLNEGTGSTAYDLSPVNNTGTIINSASGEWAYTDSLCSNDDEIAFCDTITINYHRSQETKVEIVKQNYRYAFNGKEHDDETYGEGDEYDFGARIYDPRLGRWMGVDPLANKYPALSPYNFAANSPVLLIDPDGKAIQINYMDDNGNKQSIVVTTYDQIQALTQNENCFVSATAERLLEIDAHGSDIVHQAVALTPTVEINYEDKQAEFGSPLINADVKVPTINFDPQFSVEEISNKDARTLEHFNDHANRDRETGELTKDAKAQRSDLISKMHTGRFVKNFELLAHELDHFVQSVTHPDDYAHDSKTPTANYDDLEEKRVETKGAEAKIRKNDGRDLRTNHQAISDYRVKENDDIGDGGQNKK